MSKKHQDLNNGDRSFELCDQNEAKCTHIDIAIDLNRVKKSIIKSGLLNDCEDCNNQPPVSELEELKVTNRTSNLFREPTELSLWLCLQCGNQACGRLNNMHALNHFQKPNLLSLSHCMCIDTTNLRIWCYKCNDYVNVTCNEELQKIVEYLRMVKSNPNKQQVVTPTKADKVVMDKNVTFPPLESSPIYTKLLSLGSKCILNFCGYEDGFTIGKANSETFLCDMEEYVRGKKISGSYNLLFHSMDIPKDFKFKPGEAIKLKELQKDFKNRLNI